MMINSNATWPGYDMTRYDHEAHSRAGTCRAVTCCVWEGGGGGYVRYSRVQAPSWGTERSIAEVRTYLPTYMYLYPTYM